MSTHTEPPGRRGLALAALVGACLVAALGFATDPASADYTARVQTGTLDSPAMVPATRSCSRQDAQRRSRLSSTAARLQPSTAASFTAVAVDARGGDDTVSVQNMAPALDERDHRRRRRRRHAHRRQRRRDLHRRRRQRLRRRQHRRRHGRSAPATTPSSGTPATAATPSTARAATTRCSSTAPTPARTSTSAPTARACASPATSPHHHGPHGIERIEHPRPRRRRHRHRRRPQGHRPRRHQRRPNGLRRRRRRRGRQRRSRTAPTAPDEVDVSTTAGDVVVDGPSRPTSR